MMYGDDEDIDVMSNYKEPEPEEDEEEARKEYVPEIRKENLQFAHLPYDILLRLTNNRPMKETIADVSSLREAVRGIAPETLSKEAVFAGRGKTKVAGLVFLVKRGDKQEILGVHYLIVAGEVYICRIPSTDGVRAYVRKDIKELYRAIKDGD